MRGFWKLGICYRSNGIKEQACWEIYKFDQTSYVKVKSNKHQQNYRFNALTLLKHPLHHQNTL